MIPGVFLWDNFMVTLDQVQSWWVLMSAFEWRWEAGTEARPGPYILLFNLGWLVTRWL